MIQPQLMRRRSNPISLSRIISKHVETTRERLLCKLAFAKHHARSDQLNPPIRVARRLFQSIGKTIDHFSYHEGAIRRRHGLCGLHVRRARSVLNFPRRLRSTLCCHCSAHSSDDHWLRLRRTRTTIDTHITS